MTPVLECRPRHESVVPEHSTFKIDRQVASCRTRRCSIVLSDRAHRLVPVTHQIMEIAMTAVFNRLTRQLAFGAALGAGLAVATAPILFAGRGTPTVTVPPAPVGVGWG